MSASYANLLNVPRPAMTPPRRLSWAHVPLARMPTRGRIQYAASTEPAQPSRQSALPASFRLAAPLSPPNAADTVNLSASGLGFCACTTAGENARAASVSESDSVRLDIVASTDGDELNCGNEQSDALIVFLSRQCPRARMS